MNPVADVCKELNNRQKNALIEKVKGAFDNVASRAISQYGLALRKLYKKCGGNLDQVSTKEEVRAHYDPKRFTFYILS